MSETLSDELVARAGEHKPVVSARTLEAWAARARDLETEVERLRAVIKRAYRDAPYAPDDTDLQHYLRDEVERMEGKP